jgi:hypothetical protein
MMSNRVRISFLAMVGGMFACAAAGQSIPNLAPFSNPSGFLETYNNGGSAIDLTGPFFQRLGTNGRTCFSCHRPVAGWSVSAAEVSHRFDTTQGFDPIFRTNDGSVCDHNIDTSTLDGRRKAYRLLIERGLIRIALAVPNTAEFNVINVNNPYGCGDPATLSVYRRPLPAANLRFLSAVMWDGRESSTQTGTQKITYDTNPVDLFQDLAHQAVDATNGHAQASAPLTVEQQLAIVQFEMGLNTAQAIDRIAGSLSAEADGGPEVLAKVTRPAFYVGINDSLGGDPRGGAFSPSIFNLFDPWTRVGALDARGARRASIVRGQLLFNSKQIDITAVGGLNDDLNEPVIHGTCGTCHDSPNVGNHSVAVPLNIGVGDLNSPLDISYLPVITLQNKMTYEIKTTTDPGRALISGAWKDIGKLKGPVLRGLAARAPYFHNGSAQSLADVVEFYDRRFSIGFTDQEKSDLIAFLSAL